MKCIVNPVLILAMALLPSMSVALPDRDVQGFDDFDPDAYVQVEVILFTREADAQGTNRTGVGHEDLRIDVPRRFPPGLVSIRDASVLHSPDTSWFVDEWARIEPHLVAPSEQELQSDVQDMPRVQTRPQPQVEVTSQAEPLWEAYRSWYSNLLGNCFVQMDADKWNLAAALRRIERERQLRVIMHAAWVQPVAAQPYPVLLHGGQEEEVGILGISRQDFVRAEVSMWRPLTNGYAELAITRPMRLSRAYYFDHPMMGVILRVDPVDMPPEFR